MKRVCIVLFPILALPSVVFGVDREIIQLQRDMALLQEQVQTLQRSLGKDMAALRSLLEQNVAASNKTNTSMATLESDIRSRMEEQARNLTGPVVGLTTKLDQMSTEFRSLRESVADLSDRMTKLQTELTDLSTTVRTLNAPPAPPPGGASGFGTPPAGLSAKDLYDSAMRDRSGGNADLALQGFQEYLKWFPTSELAPNAQYYLGEIYFNKADFANAVSSFDAVLERFPENNKTPDAMYMKGMALLKSNQRDEAAREFLNVIEKYPNAEVTAKARAQRRALGLSVPPPKSKTRRTG
jgi:tol-pal system protein YbgF